MQHWLKHPFSYRGDHEVAQYLDDSKDSLAAYGFLWAVIENCAEAMQHNDGDPTAIYSETTWCRRVGCHSNRFQSHIRLLDASGLVELRLTDKQISVRFPKLLIWQASYSKSSKNPRQKREEQQRKDQQREEQNASAPEPAFVKCDPALLLPPYPEDPQSADWPPRSTQPFPEGADLESKLLWVRSHYRSEASDENGVLNANLLIQAVLRREGRPNTNPSPSQLAVAESVSRKPKGGVCNP